MLARKHALRDNGIPYVKTFPSLPFMTGAGWFSTSCLIKNKLPIALFVLCEPHLVLFRVPFCNLLVKSAWPVCLCCKRTTGKRVVPTHSEVTCQFSHFGSPILKPGRFLWAPFNLSLREVSQWTKLWRLKALSSDVTKSHPCSMTKLIQMKVPYIFLFFFPLLFPSSRNSPLIGTWDAPSCSQRVGSIPGGKQHKGSVALRWVAGDHSRTGH